MARLRQLLLAVLILAAAARATATAGEVGSGPSFKGPTGLQLYSLRDMQKTQGVAATLDKTQRLGFKYVEVADFGPLSPAQFRAELTRRGLVPVGRHFPYVEIRDDIERVAAVAKELGLKYVGCAWINHFEPFGAKQCRVAAAVFNRAAAALAKHGLKFYYHNHGYEFRPHGEETLFDLLASETDPKTVFFEMDVLWTVLPGQDPVKLLEKYPGRWLMLHLKDLRKGVPTGDLSATTAATNDVALGTGQVDWPAVLRTAERVGVKYYFIEDESPTPLEQIPQSLRYLESVKW
jgi:sugar phosphate isomerase/epimerase